MKTLTITVYDFDELSDNAKEKALQELRNINIEHEWYDGIYEDAANIGLKIEAFDIGRGCYCTGDWTTDALDAARRIIKNHGEHCETYKDAKAFLQDHEALAEHDDVESEFEDLEDDFLQTMLGNYRMMLQKEFEYLTSDGAIKETIDANGYCFHADGTLA